MNKIPLCSCDDLKLCGVNFVDLCRHQQYRDIRNDKCHIVFVLFNYWGIKVLTKSNADIQDMELNIYMLFAGWEVRVVKNL